MTNSQYHPLDICLLVNKLFHIKELLKRQYGENKTKTFNMHSILDVVRLLVENGMIKNQA